MRCLMLTWLAMPPPLLAVPPLKKNPIFLYSYDRFQKPTPFQADIVVSIDSVIDKKVEALALIESQ